MSDKTRPATAGERVSLQDLSPGDTTSLAAVNPGAQTLAGSSTPAFSQPWPPPLAPSSSHASSGPSPFERRPGSEISRPSRASRGSQTSLTPAQVHTLITSRKNRQGSRTLNLPEGISDEASNEASRDSLEELLPVDEQPVPTPKCLQEFDKVTMRTINAQNHPQENNSLEKSRKRKTRHEQTLQNLRIWVGANLEVRSLKGILKSILNLGQGPRCPSSAQIVAMAKYYYPMRADFKIYVCDFGKGRFSKQEVPLGKVDEELYNKPDWSTVRWIHAPLNVGLVHASLEDRFLAVRRTSATRRSTDISWPYAQMETIAVRKHGDLQDLQDVKRILTVFKKFSKVNQELNGEALEGIGPELAADIKWRAGHYRVQPDYWELAASDCQRQLSSGSTLNPFYAQEKHVLQQLEKQTISIVPFYKNAQIVRFPFRCFHRSDGFLLSMAGGHQIDFLDAKFEEHLNRPADTFFDNSDSSVIGLMFELFAKTGTSTWYKNDVDWFLIYLLTEVAAAPHSLRQGGNAPHLRQAYQNVVQDLKDRRYEKFDRNKSVGLVREYLSCIDELTNINAIYTRKLGMLNALKNQVQRPEADKEVSAPNNPDGESASSRLDWAISRVTEDSTLTQELLVDVRESLTALFQLRSIEQNELAIVADTQNRAVLVFTAVTTIFLPLSFITSYYGMNLKGISNTTKTESFFWKISVSVSILIFLVIFLMAFQSRLRSQLHNFRMSHLTV